MLPQGGVVLLSHVGCPYICGYIWSGYPGSTTLRDVKFASLYEAGLSQNQFPASTFLLSLFCAANSRRILPGLRITTQLALIH